jgi:hypothetical protein
MHWIVLHTNEKMESMVKGRIYPRALPNQGQDQLNELKFLEQFCPFGHVFIVAILFHLIELDWIWIDPMTLIILR